ncbi:MAG: hypothetical protein O2967_17760 [Proteobacteria bacterium]|nr:hypothetical protein [Pseudomonadota bacterium]
MLVDGSGPVTGADGNNVRVNFAEADAGGLAELERSTEAPRPETPIDPTQQDGGGGTGLGPDAGDAGVAETSADENAVGASGNDASQAGEATSGGKYRGMAAQYDEEFAEHSPLSGETGAKRSEEEIAEARRIAKLLAIRLDGDPADPEGPPPEYKKLAFLQAIPAMTLISTKEVLALAAAIFGGAAVSTFIRGIKISDGAETARAEASTPDPPGKALLGWGGKPNEDMQKRYDILADNLIKIWIQPLRRRGNEVTQEGNDIVVQQCLDVLKTEFPDLAGLIDHVGGATKDGKGEINVKEGKVPNRNGSNLKYGYSYPDLSFKGTIFGKWFAAYINTADRNLRGDWTSWERFSLARLIRNAGKDFVIAMRKLKKDDDREEYARDAREVCRVVMKNLQDRLNEEKKKQGKEGRNKKDDDKNNNGKERP